jgi:hypothetical protein
MEYPLDDSIPPSVTKYNLEYFSIAGMNPVMVKIGITPSGINTGIHLNNHPER